MLGIRALIIPVFLGIGVCGICDGFASDPYPVDVTQSALTESVDFIDHLEPVHGTVPELYYIAQFIESPSFTKGSYFVVFRTEDGKYKLAIDTLPVDKRPSQAPKGEIELEIPESTAKVIYEIWINALLEVRYDRKTYGGTDGTTFIFSSFRLGAGWMHGTAWSPRPNTPPRWLVDSARGIIAFAHDPKRDAQQIEVFLLGIRDKLLKYLKTHGRN